MCRGDGSLANSDNRLGSSELICFRTTRFILWACSPWHPENLQRLQNEDYVYLLNLEKQYNVKLTFRADPSYHVENFRIVPTDK